MPTSSAPLPPITTLAREHLGLGDLLHALERSHGGYTLLDHWVQGEFHHDLVLRVGALEGLPSAILLVATNCNGGVKELLSFAEPPDRWALWHQRCPTNPEFFGELPEPLAVARTPHWFDPCELLTDDARSELKPECRRRQRGGGFEPIDG